MKTKKTLSFGVR